jgi:UDP-glucose 4-epimerase
MNILVTGGAGFIGSHCCKALHRKGYIPVTIDNLIYGHRENVRWGSFYQGDAGDSRILDRIFKDNKIDAVMHFAAFAYVGESVTDPQKYYANNVKNTINLLQSILENNVRFFIFSSTCATYGMPQKLPLYENHRRQPISPYGKSKYMIEEILADYHTAYDFEFISLRYFNAAGADPESEIGEKHDPETHLIPLILDVAKGRSEAIRVFGTDYETADGSCIRDYIHVSDLADAHILALEKLMDGSSSDFINLGTGSGFSVLQSIETASRVTGKNIPHIAADRRPGDPAVLTASNEKARRILGWKPRYTQLDEIIQTAWNWHKKL